MLDVFVKLILHQERITAMEELLENVGDRMAMLVQKPSTRVQACQLLAKTKVKVTTKELGEQIKLAAVGSPKGSRRF